MKRVLTGRLIILKVGKVQKVQKVHTPDLSLAGTIYYYYYLLLLLLLFTTSYYLLLTTPTNSTPSLSTSQPLNLIILPKRSPMSHPLPECQHRYLLYLLYLLPLCLNLS